MAPKKKVKVVPEMNIPLEVFERWQELKTHGCGKGIVTDTGLDKTEVSQALKWGFCRKPEWETKISEWFLNRIESEKKNPVKLNAASSKLLKMKP